MNIGRRENAAEEEGSERNRPKHHQDDCRKAACSPTPP
jgi:hypothetical protein